MREIILKVCIGLVLSLIVVFAVFRLWAASASNRAVRAYQQAGHPVTVEELIAMRYTAPPDTDNGVPLLKQAMDQYVEADETTQAAIQAMDCGETLTPQQIALVHEHLRANEPVMAALSEALHTPAFHWGKDFSDPIAAMLPSLGDIRKLAMLGVRDHRLHRDHWPDDLALEAIEQSIRISETLAGEPDLISQLVRISTLTLAMTQVGWFLEDHPPQRHHLAWLDNRFTAAREHLGNAMSLALEGEVIYGLTIFERLYDGTMVIEAGDKPGGLLFSIVGLFDPDRACYIRSMGEMMTVAGLDDLRERVMRTQTKDQQPDPPRWAVVTNILVPSLGAPIRNHVAAMTKIQTVQLALVIEQRHLEGHALPADLSELAADHIDAVPIDPFDGQPLRYMRLDDGYVIYSVGTNGTDDGGAVERSEGKPAPDLGIRVQRADLRRVQ